MKHAFIALLGALVVNLGWAQLPDGTISPDFTAASASATEAPPYPSTSYASAASPGASTSSWGWESLFPRSVVPDPLLRQFGVQMAAARCPRELEGKWKIDPKSSEGLCPFLKGLGMPGFICPAVGVLERSTELNITCVPASAAADTSGAEGEGGKEEFWYFWIGFMQASGNTECIAWLGW